MNKRKWPVFMGIRVSESMAEMLKEKMEEEELSMSQLVRKALLEYLLK